MKKHTFTYKKNQLHIENLPLAELAEKYGTPLYIYSYAALKENFLSYENALMGHSHLLSYAVKANGNLAILNALAQLGAGFDIVSQGELERVLAAGGDSHKVIFSGVGKQKAEIERALQVGIHSFNIESEAELEMLDEITRESGIHTNISFRVNPNVDPKTHPYIATGLKDTKFGVSIEKAKELYRRAAKMPNLHIEGVDCHIGSQITTIEPFLEALDHLLALIDDLAEESIVIKNLDMGGGLGIAYTEDVPPAPSTYVDALLQRVNGRDLNLLLEPGRSIVGDAGILLTRVISIKNTEGKNFAIIDAAMNDLHRPALYQAWHDILPVTRRTGQTGLYDIAGPVCESSDFLGKNRELNIKADDLLVIMDSGAYGSSMASNYNARPRPAEVMVRGDHARLIRERESYDDLMRGETLSD